jgi:hypothetical protein
VAIKNATVAMPSTAIAMRNIRTLRAIMADTPSGNRRALLVYLSAPEQGVRRNGFASANLT